MTDIRMENCGFATNETVPARIVAASLDPKVLKAAGRLVAGRRDRSATSLRREHLRLMRGLIADKNQDHSTTLCLVFVRQQDRHIFPVSIEISLEA
jgi:hypothetical protein